MNNNEVIAGVDVGRVRVGVALGYPATGIVLPFAIYPRASGRAERLLLALLSERKINKLVAGIPLEESGKSSEQCDDIHRFCNRIAKRCSVEISYTDEYLSSVEARERMTASPQRRESTDVDDIAAAIILERYLAGSVEKSS